VHEVQHVGVQGCSADNARDLRGRQHLLSGGACCVWQDRQAEHCPNRQPRSRTPDHCVRTCLLQQAEGCRTGAQAVQGPGGLHRRADREGAEEGTVRQRCTEEVVFLQAEGPGFSAQDRQQQVRLRDGLQEGRRGCRQARLFRTAEYGESHRRPGAGHLPVKGWGGAGVQQREERHRVRPPCREDRCHPRGQGVHSHACRHAFHNHPQRHACPPEGTDPKDDLRQAGKGTGMHVQLHHQGQDTVV